MNKANLLGFAHPEHSDWLIIEEVEGNSYAVYKPMAYYVAAAQFGLRDADSVEDEKLVAWLNRNQGKEVSCDVEDFDNCPSKADSESLGIEFEYPFSAGNYTLDSELYVCDSEGERIVHNFQGDVADFESSDALRDAEEEQMQQASDEISDVFDIGCNPPVLYTHMDGEGRIRYRMSLPIPA